MVTSVWKKTLGLAASGFMWPSCAHICVCIVCTLASLLPLLSVIPHLFLTFSLLPLSLPHHVSHSGPERERLEDTERRNLLRTRAAQGSARGYESAVRDTHLYTVKQHRLMHIYSPSHGQMHLHTNTNSHTVVLIKALSVSREICNPDI